MRRTLVALPAIAAVLLAIVASPVSAVEFKKGNLEGSLDTTLTFGTSWRLDDPDRSIIGLANGGTGFSVNGDNGNQNYETGVYSMTPKITSELELDAGRFGLFVRGSFFYDRENEAQGRDRTELGDAELDRVGSRADLLDAYIRFDFDIGSQPAEIRVGQQALSWGESTFIQNGISTINPFEVSALRVPGAELREALIPEEIVWGNFALTTNTSIELFYQYDWNDTEIDPPGSYFSTNDFVGDGGDTVFLGFGSSGDIPPFSDPTDPNRPFLGVSRDRDVAPDDQGQYGAAFRWFVPALNDTEFGVYYINYHSRVPTINGRTGTLDGAVTAGTISAAAPRIVTAVQTFLAGNPGDIPGAVAAGTGAGLANGAPLGASQAIAGTSATGGDVASVTRGFATDAYAQTAGYFLEYPEDIELYGLSFNTELGTSGIALQGEASYRIDAPLQVDDVELLFAALSPISPVFAGTSGIPGEPGASQLGQFLGEDYSTQFETEIPGFILRDVVQYQATGTKIFGPGLGASTSVLLAEVAMTHIEDMPDKSELRLEGPGTYTSGNPYHQDAANPGAGHAGKPAEGAGHFADSTSWGYRLAGRLEYNRALGAVNLLPRFSFQHDVNGVSPGPGGNFIEDRKALTLGLTGVYQNSWSGDISYTRYYGAGRYNLINDRDFIAVNMKYSF